MSPAKLVVVFLFLSISSAYPGHGTTPDNSVVPNGHMNPKFTHGSYPSPGVGDGDWTHVGVDIGADCGSDVYAFADGKVLEVVKQREDWRYSKGLGFAVLIKHSAELNTWNQKPFYTLYLHLNEPTLKDVGDPVVGRQTVIGKVGNKGTKAEGTDENCHTHFEIRYFQGIEGFWHPQWGEQTESGMKLNIYGRGNQSESPLLTTDWKDPELLLREHRQEITQSMPQKAAPVHECDTLAADPEDDNRVAEGVSGRLDERSVEACKDAISQFPGVARFEYQYARVLINIAGYQDTEARSVLRKAAERNYAIASHLLGELYYTDYNRTGLQDAGLEAQKWHQRAAELGYAPAQARLGRWYQIGRIGVSKDRTMAIEWYEKAASQGNADAMLSLGELYRIEKDYDTAAKWFQKLANSPSSRLANIAEVNLKYVQFKIELAEREKARQAAQIERQKALRNAVVPKRNAVVPNAKFGEFRHGTYPSLGDRTHVGVDLVAPCGSPVFAFADGRVVDLIKDKGDPNFDSLGFMVLISHGSPLFLFGRDTYTLYLHLQAAPQIKKYQEVQGGQTVIGYVGKTGNAFGCHTHFEVRYFSDRFQKDWSNIYGPGDQGASSVFRRYWIDPLGYLALYPDGLTLDIVKQAMASVKAKAITILTKARIRFRDLHPFGVGIPSVMFRIDPDDHSRALELLQGLGDNVEISEPDNRIIMSLNSKPKAGSKAIEIEQQPVAQIKQDEKIDWEKKQAQEFSHRDGETPVPTVMELTPETAYKLIKHATRFPEPVAESFQNIKKRDPLGREVERMILEGYFVCRQSALGGFSVTKKGKYLVENCVWNSLYKKYMVTFYTHKIEITRIVDILTDKSTGTAVVTYEVGLAEAPYLEKLREIDPARVQREFGGQDIKSVRKQRKASLKKWDQGWRVMH